MPDYIIEEDLAQVPIKTQLRIDNVYITPTTKTFQLRTNKVSLDEDSNVLKSEAGPNFIYMNRDDNPETPEDESSTAFTDVMKKIAEVIKDTDAPALNKAVLVQVIKEMEGIE